MIYNKEYSIYLVFDLIPGPELLKPLEFAVIRVIKSLN